MKLEVTCLLLKSRATIIVRLIYSLSILKRWEKKKTDFSCNVVQVTVTVTVVNIPGFPEFSRDCSLLLQKPRGK